MDYEGFQTAIAGLGDGDKNTALEVRNLLTNMLECIFLPGDIKWVWCTQEDIDNDYTSTGLGIGKRSGWGLCNGLGGRPPMGGRVPIGINDKYSIGDTGGSENAVLVSHNHNFVLKGKSGGSNGITYNDGTGTDTNYSTESSGESGVGKNMQPFIALVAIMKLP